ncbi:MAG: DUF835 domain-containing protein [Theionarchaea archaeon]|nr:DUF835 domain-containing protein [Theionarchaea archaeon]
MVEGAHHLGASYCGPDFKVVTSFLLITGFKLTKYFSPPEEPQEMEKPHLKGGHMYLVKGKDVERSYVLFADVVNQDTEGLLITRRIPPQVQAADKFPHVHAFWLSHLLDGLEYLIVHNKFDQVLKQLYIIREVLSRHGGILLIPLDPEAFSEKEMGFLEKESVPI